MDVAFKLLRTPKAVGDVCTQHPSVVHIVGVHVGPMFSIQGDPATIGVALVGTGSGRTAQSLLPDDNP